jgi:inosose dehydratase
VIRVGNAPCSWGALEFASTEQPAPASQVLEEMSGAGYAGTELGDWGFLPTTPNALRAEVGRRALTLIAAFVPVALARAEAVDEGVARAVRTAQLLAAAAGPDAFIVLSDDNASVANRTTRAGRIRAEDGLTAGQWDAFARRAERVASQVRETSGLRTVVHHHCGGYVETPEEIDALCSRTDPALLGLCLDTGHLAFAGGDPLAALSTYADRIWHVHFKDCEPSLAAQSRMEGWDYHTSVRQGIFCELGRGTVPFDSVIEGLRARAYDGWIVVEQDVLPGLGTPAESARRNREFLRRLGI